MISSNGILASGNNSRVDPVSDVAPGLSSNFLMAQQDNMMPGNSEAVSSRFPHFFCLKKRILLTIQTHG